MITQLLEKNEIANETLAFYLKKPEGFTFKAGQFVDITLINPPETDAGGNRHAYSIASEPAEDRLMSALRLRDSAYKRVLKNLSLGADIEISQPQGSFTLHNDTTRPAVFLIGGIGITPVRSIVKDSLTRGLPHQLYLFYSNRTPEDTAFLTEFEALALAHPQFHFIPTMTSALADPSAWTGQTGYIDETLLRKSLPDLNQATFYLAGPEKMVTAMRTLLDSLHVDSDYIKTEEFSGY